MDITALRQTEAARLRLAMVVRDSQDAVMVQDLEGHILAWNPGAAQIYGWSEAEALTMNVRQLVPAPAREEALTQVRQLSQSTSLAPYRSQRITKQGTPVEVSMIATALVNEAGQLYAIATTERVVAPAAPAPRPAGS